MEKIDLKKYYIEEHVYKGYYYDPDFIITAATAELSKRLVYLSRNGYVIGKYKKIDHTKRDIPEPIFGSQYKVNFHFLIALRKNFIVDNSRTKLMVLKLLNKKGFREQIEGIKNLIHTTGEPYEEIRGLMYQLINSDLKPQEQIFFTKIKKDRAITNKDFTKQMMLDTYAKFLKKKFRVADEYTFVLQSIIDYGLDYTIEFIDDLVESNLSYLDYYNCVPYFVNDPTQDKSGIGCKYIRRPQFKNIKKAFPIILYFSNHYFLETIELPGIDYNFFYRVHVLAHQTPKLSDKQIAAHLNNGRCGQREIDRIKQTKRRLRQLLA